jgi:FAD/FMN-containing dehydrogenase/Fe-S oxidoreductase
VIPHKQLQDDLRGEFRGQLHVDLPHRHIYAADASPFHITPHAVAIPEDEDDLRTIITYAHEHNLPIIPRGAGTGLSGESLGGGLILDLSVNFQRIREITGDTVRAECGVVLADLNAELAKVGRRFAPNPLSAKTCTIGGMIGTDASGPNVFAHGYTRRHTRGLRVVWDNGETATLTPSKQTSDPDTTPQLRTIEIRSQAIGLLSQHRERIVLARPHTAFDHCGYGLHEAVTKDGLDLVNLLVGTEGTLAVVSEAILGTVPLPGGRACFMLGFRTLNEALRAGLTLRSVAGITECDVADQRLLTLARSSLARIQWDIADDVNAVLAAEFEADSPTLALAIARDALNQLRSAFDTATLAECTNDTTLRVAGFRQAIATATYTVSRSTARPVPFVEDTAVPGEELIRYVSGLSEFLRRAELSGLFLVSPLTGQVQLRPLLDLRQPHDREAMWPLADQVYKLVSAIGGTMSTRHGTGLTRTPWIATQWGNLTPVFAQLRRIFDPKNLLNPGKITAPDPSRPAWPMWQETEPVPKDLPPTSETTPPRLPLLIWTGEQLPIAENRCNGCGDCRSRLAPARMCPTFQATRLEASSPRAQAALYHLLNGPTRDEALTAEETRAIAELCVNCKMCRTECPSSADIPTLALEAKANLYAANGLNRDEWILARIGGLLRIAGIATGSTNLLLGLRPTRWLIEKLFGLSRKRILPKLNARSFLSRARRAGLTTRKASSPFSGRASAIRVAYFVDTFANHADPLIGEAVVAVLNHNGIDVYVPPRQRGSGVAALSQGDLDTARELAARNVRVFADLIRDGYAIIASEPTAIVTLAQDYPKLIDDADTKLVATHTQELTMFLWKLHEKGWLRTDFPKPLEISLGHHVPCHIKALGELPAGPKVLGLIPGLQVTLIDKSCSGMAGTYGLKASSYDDSLRTGKPMLDELNQAHIRYGSTECGTCRMQMQEGTRKRTLHPVQYLAIAYGLVPELSKRLRKPLGKLVSD